MSSKRAFFMGACFGLTLWLVGGDSVTLGQTPDEATRRLWDTAFIKQAKPARATKARSSRRRSRYRVNTPNVPTAGVAGDTVVGVTIWRLRHAASAESGERLLVQEGADAGEWLPERISADTRLAQGDRVRISVEAARTGYLYVIDREQYADGTMSEPYLIFPTTRTLGGNNEVKVGKVIEIPAQEDKPPYFTLRRTRPDQAAEVLSVLVTPTPLEGIQIGATAQKLSTAQVAQWEKSWSSQVGSLELEDGAGKAWTKAERDAAASASKTLNADAPVPQTLYYSPRAKATEPLLLRVQLRYRRPTRNTHH
jgi:hypothetical protein